MTQSYFGVSIFVPVKTVMFPHIHSFQFYVLKYLGEINFFCRPALGKYKKYIRPGVLSKRIQKCWHSSHFCRSLEALPRPLRRALVPSRLWPVGILQLPWGILDQGNWNRHTDVTAAVACTTVNINSFTVPAGQALTLNLLTGTTVNMSKISHFKMVTWWTAF